MKKSPIIFLAAFSLLLTYSCKKSEETAEKDTSKTSMTEQKQEKKELSSAEKDFLTKAANGGTLEVALGKLAHEKAMSKDVKELGHHIMMDHKKSGEDLKKIAAEKNVMLSDSLDKDGMDMKEKLAKLSGKEFDKKYLQEMIDDHKKDIKDFEDMAENAQDPAIKSYAKENLPTLRNHFMQAQKLDSMMNAKSGKSKSMNKTSMR